MGSINFKGIVDTTFREGQQSPLLFDTYKYRFNLEDKKNLIKALIKLGIRRFEFFSPIVSTIKTKEFKKLKEYALSINKDKLYFLAHCRCHPTDIEKAIKAGFNGLHLYMGISEKTIKDSYQKNRKDVYKQIIKTVVETRKKYPDIYLRYSTEDAFRTDIKDVYDIYDKIHLYVETLGSPDTVGIARPDIVAKRIKMLKKRYPKNNIECHFHNDQGNSIINAVTAVNNGAEFIDATIWGLGERSGITSITGLLLNLTLINKNITKKYNLKLCYPLNVLMGTILKIQVPYNEPVSLTNRTHIAGVHQKAVLKNGSVYEALNLEKFGVSKHQLLLGPLTGWNLIYYYLKEIENYQLSHDQAKKISKEFKNKINKINKNNSPEKLIF